jgi:hypothetical protein
MTGLVHGYTNTTSAKAGETVDFHLGWIKENGSGSVSLAIRNASDPDAKEVWENVAIREYDKPQPREGWNADFKWDVTKSVQVPTSWTPGLYALFHGIDSTDPEKIICWFVIRGDKTDGAVLVHVPTLTLHAYAWSALYYYADEGQRLTRLSLHRSQATHHYVFLLLQWLAKNGYTAHCASSIDLHSAAFSEEYRKWLRSYPALLLAYHDEYWTPEMRDAVEGFVTSGGNLISLSGNTAYRQVRLAPANDVNPQTAVFFKHSLRDPEPDPRRVAVAFAQSPPDRPQNAFFGFGFNGGAMSGSRAGVEPTTKYTYHYANGEHWVFEGVTEAKSGAFLGYEADAVDFAFDGDKPYATGESGAPRTCAVLATANLSDWTGKPGFATISLLRRNGAIFSGGNTDWLLALDKNDASISRITHNVLRRLTKPMPSFEDIGALPVGSGEAIRGLAFVAGYLFLMVRNATDTGTLYRRRPSCAPMPWTRAGDFKQTPVTMTASTATLYAISNDNRLWHRDPMASDLDWECVGKGSSAGTAALTYGSGLFFLLDSDRASFWQAAVPEVIDPRPEKPSVGTWFTFEKAKPQVKTGITCLAYDSGQLYAAEGTSILRTANDLIVESDKWGTIETLPARPQAIAIVDRMLFAAAENGRLYALDLYGRRQDFYKP